MLDAIVTPPIPVNEPILSYAPGSPERAALKAELAGMPREPIEIPMVIDGRDVTSGRFIEVRSPHRREQLLARAHAGAEADVTRAIDAAKRAHRPWSELPWTARAAVI